MNPLTNVKNQNKLNQRELELGLTNKKSWHDKYKDSAWIFIGGLPYDLTEGDVLCIFSQYGEIVNINLVRDQKSGKSKGFCFVCYEDQRSTILAVDNFNGAKVLGRIMRVDHVEEYKKPKEHGDEDEITMKLRADGCAPKIASSPEPEEDLLPLEIKKEKKVKKEKKKKKKKKKSSSSEDSSDSEDDSRAKKKLKIKQENDSVKVKKEKHDTGYDKALKGTLASNKRHYTDSDDSEVDSKYPRSESQNRHGNRNSDLDRDRNVGHDRQRNYADSDRSRSKDFEARRDRDSDRRLGRQSYGERSPERSRNDSFERDRYEDRHGRNSSRDVRDEQRDRDHRGDSRDQRGRDRETDYRKDFDRSDRNRDRDRGYRR